MIPTTNGKFDPNKIFPWMIWERFAQGRTLVGVDENDADFASAGLELGEKEHQLTVDEMANHAHFANYTADAGAINVTGLCSGVGSIYGPVGNVVRNAGGDQPHNNIQPSTTVYYWRRVS